MKSSEVFRKILMGLLVLIMLATFQSCKDSDDDDDDDDSGSSYQVEAPVNTQSD